MEKEIFSKPEVDKSSSSFTAAHKDVTTQTCSSHSLGPLIHFQQLKFYWQTFN